MTDGIPPPDDREWLTVVETARELKVGEETVRRWIANGTIPHWRPGPRTIRVPRAALERVRRKVMRSPH